MATNLDFSSMISSEWPILKIILGVAVIITLFNFFFSFLKKKLLQNAKSKKQLSNIKILSKIINVTFFLIVIFLAFFYAVGSWTGLGLMAGLVTAGLGFALQKPITSIAAWVMVVLKRPFSIGDRIMIGNVKGEVYDISLTHVYIDEVGGDVNSEELSGRNVMVPNHLLFEHNIINYTLVNDFVLAEVTANITFEGDLDKAIELAKKAATKHLQEYIKETKKEPKIRVELKDSGIDLKIRFYAPIKELPRVKSDISKEIYDVIKKQKDVSLAYPHTEMIINDEKASSNFKKK
ncbi:MAG: mechanosensitive ion channel family protein [Nanoarchaeota archaeon]|nr:mechanosensitive ion channel family protein [Nanoarchaeota archaeon]